MEEVSLRELNGDNWYECCLLKVGKTQEDFVDSNAISIAQSKYENTLETFGIYLGEKMVGFTMHNTVIEELDGYWIYRIMVDENHQGKGIGRKAMKIVVEKVKKLDGCKRIVVGYSHENEGAEKLYQSMGFVDRGDRFGKETAVVLDI